MRRVGLSGGIGSGKSTAAMLFAQLGAVVIDADAVAREVVERGTPGLKLLVSEFGDEVLTEAGDLDRAHLAAIVFADEDRRARLNAIVHPLVAQRSAQLMAQATDSDVVVHDVPLLVELGMADHYDAVVIIDCPDDLRLTRLVERGLDPADARRRMQAQATREQRLAVADHVIDNSGSLADLQAQVETVWRELAG